MSVVTTSPSLKNILNSVGINASNADSAMKNIHAKDQALAGKRDELILRGSKLSGWGLSGQRIEWASDCLAYAFEVSAGKKAAFIKAIDDLHAGSNALSNGMHQAGKSGRDPMLHKSIQLAMVYQKIKAVKLMDWGVACMFVRFVKAYNPAQPELLFEPEALALATDIVSLKAELLSKRGTVDPKKVKEAIGVIFGDVVEEEAPAGEGEKKESDDGEQEVTSEEAIAMWFKQADEAALDRLGSLMGDRVGQVSKYWLQNLNKFMK